MKNKQIIIDGVTVSRCCYYNEGKCLGCFALNKDNCISCYGICKKINDCYYKQLKRKEQECEMWKNLTVDNGAVALNYQKTIDQLKTENEHFSEKEKEARHYLEEAYKLSQILTEIKKIAKPQTYYIDINKNKTATELEYDYANIVWNLEQKMHKIIQKISEVENDK